MAACPDPLRWFAAGLHSISKYSRGDDRKNRLKVCEKLRWSKVEFLDVQYHFLMSRFGRFHARKGYEQLLASRSSHGAQREVSTILAKS